MTRPAQKNGIARRELLGGAVLLGAAGFAQLFPNAGQAQVVIFEGDQPASHAFAHSIGAARRIDLAADAHSHWRGLRELKRGHPVTGYTGWDAYVAARGCLEGQGLRMTSEVLDRQRGLVAWTMA